MTKPKIDPWPLSADELPRSLAEILIAYNNAITRLCEQGAEFSPAELAVARRQLENLFQVLYER
jgi:hypothetical protein